MILKDSYDGFYRPPGGRVSGPMSLGGGVYPTAGIPYPLDTLTHILPLQDTL